MGRWGRWGVGGPPLPEGLAREAERGIESLAFAGAEGQVLATGSFDNKCRIYLHEGEAWRMVQVLEEARGARGRERAGTHGRWRGGSR